MKIERCMFCKKKIGKHFNDIPLCSSAECIAKLKQKNINLFRKYKFLNSLQQRSGISNDQKTVTLVSTRPWSSTGVLNLYENMKNNWSSLRSAKETKRTIGDIKRMTRIIEKEGFETVYFNLLKIETLKRSSVSKEILWLKEHGIISVSKKK